MPQKSPSPLGWSEGVICPGQVVIQLQPRSSMIQWGNRKSWEQSSKSLVSTNLDCWVWQKLSRFLGIHSYLAKEIHQFSWEYFQLFPQLASDGWRGLQVHIPNNSEHPHFLTFRKCRIKAAEFTYSTNHLAMICHTVLVLVFFNCINIAAGWSWINQRMTLPLYWRWPRMRGKGGGTWPGRKRWRLATLWPEGEPWSS